MVEQAVPQGAVERALEQQLFGRFATIDRVVAIPVTPIVLLKNNPERIGFVITNTGNISVTLALGQDITLDQGIILPAQPDTLSANYIEDGQTTTHEFSAIASAANAEVYVLEFIRVSE